jgi:hypothetical protein
VVVTSTDPTSSQARSFWPRFATAAGVLLQCDEGADFKTSKWLFVWTSGQRMRRWLTGWVLDRIGLKAPAVEAVAA